MTDGDIAKLSAHIQVSGNVIGHAGFFFQPTKFLPQSLEFFEWLKNNHESYILDQDTSQEETLSLVIQFCQDLHYTNLHEFSKEITN